jgi:RHS repeat-associated protein
MTKVTEYRKNLPHSISLPFTQDYEIRVDVPFDGYTETGLDVDAATLPMNGHYIDITGVSSAENNVTYYFGDDLEYRLSGGAVTTIENVLAGENIARRVHVGDFNNTAPYEYPIKNHLGSTMFTTDESGNLEGTTYDYFPYGKQEVVMIVADNPKITQTFTGKELDLYDGDAVNGEDGEGRYYFGKRYYDADVGRWVAVDPGRQYIDLFNYCESNPLTKIDKNGGYGEDVHYYLTLSVALNSGLDPLDAQAIAIADQEVDLLPSFTPNPFRNGIRKGLGEIGKCWVNAQKFHFTYNRRVEFYNKCIEAAQKGNLESFGTNLHLYQDSFSHQGGRIAHLASTFLNWLHIGRWWDTYNTSHNAADQRIIDDMEMKKGVKELTDFLSECQNEKKDK